MASDYGSPRPPTSGPGSLARSRRPQSAPAGGRTAARGGGGLQTTAVVSQGTLPHAWEAGTVAERQRRREEKGGHRRAMKLAAMYQRIPYTTLTKASGRNPSGWAAQRLPPHPVHVLETAAWERARRSAALSTTYDEAQLGRRMWRPRWQGEKEPQRWCDKSFAVWEPRGFPPGTTLEDALERLEDANAVEERILKYQINFKDGFQIRFSRSEPDDPQTLYCVEDYELPPRGRKKRAPAAPQRFSADCKGHLLGRTRRMGCSSFMSRMRDEAAGSGGVGFGIFTKMSYNRHEVRENKNLVGVRPGLCETSNRATEFRPPKHRRAKALPLADRFDGSWTSRCELSRTAQTHQLGPASASAR